MKLKRIETLGANFCCPKCKGRSAQVDQARLPLVGGRFPLKPGKFLVVTCTLCGYTEFYDQSVFAEEHETSDAKSPVPSRPATSDLGS